VRGGGSQRTGVNDVGLPGSSSEAGSSLKRIDFVYHSTLGVRVIKKKKKGDPDSAAAALPHSPTFLWCRAGWSTYFWRVEG